jgi:hypothetical protein
MSQGNARTLCVVQLNATADTWPKWDSGLSPDMLSSSKVLSHPLCASFRLQMSVAAPHLFPLQCTVGRHVHARPGVQRGRLRDDVHQVELVTW